MLKKFFTNVSNMLNNFLDFCYKKFNIMFVLIISFFMAYCIKDMISGGHDTYILVSLLIFAAVFGYFAFIRKNNKGK